MSYDAHTRARRMMPLIRALSVELPLVSALRGTYLIICQRRKRQDRCRHLPAPLEDQYFTRAYYFSRRVPPRRCFALFEKWQWPTRTARPRIATISTEIE